MSLEVLPANATEAAAIDQRGAVRAMAVVREFVDRPLWPVQVDPAEKARVEVLLAVITYCYARGCFRSDDVVRMGTEDPSVRWLVGEADPTVDEIRQVRRKYFSLATACLAEFVLRSAVSQPGRIFAGEAERLRRAIAEKHANERLAAAVLKDSAAA